LQEAFEILALEGVDRRLAYDLVKRAQFAAASKDREAVLDAIASELLESVETLPPIGSDRAGGTGPMIVALVGPSGVGKSTTIVKMASEAERNRKLKCGLIHWDPRRGNTFDRLATLAKLCGLPFRAAGSVADLKAAVQDFQQLDVVLIDTGSVSPKETDTEATLVAGLEAVGAVSHLVLAAPTRDDEMLIRVERFKRLRPQGLVFTKLDETSTFGAIYNTCRRSRLPLLYFTNGQKVPSDIEVASRERLVSLILEL
jgi:flagellar biosynthesis protein FlhF